MAEGRFLRVVGQTARRHGASLYYPAAGLDLRAFLSTRISHAVFLDPQYFHTSKMDLRSLKRSVRIIDAHATFIRPTQRVLTARFRHGRMPRSVTFVRGGARKDESLVGRYTEGKIVYLAKGCLLPKVLLPPQAIQTLSPVAFALAFLDVPKYSSTIRHAYVDPLIDLYAAPMRLLIFGRYRYVPSRDRRAQEQFETWLRRAGVQPKREHAAVAYRSSSASAMHSTQRK